MNDFLIAEKRMGINKWTMKFAKGKILIKKIA